MFFTGTIVRLEAFPRSVLLPDERHQQHGKKLKCRSNQRWELSEKHHFMVEYGHFSVWLPIPPVLLKDSFT